MCVCVCVCVCTYCKHISQEITERKYDIVMLQELFLFRLTEPDRDGGAILIGGRDSNSLPLFTLRHSLALVTQEPTLFSLLQY